MSNFWKRALTGFFFLVIMVGAILWSYWSLCALFFIIAMLGLNEFYTLINHAGIYPQKWLGLSIGALLFLATVVSSFFCGGIIFIVIPFVLCVFFAELFRNKPNPFQNIAFTLLGIFYVVLPFAAWVALVSPGDTWRLYPFNMAKYNPDIILGFFILLWTNDTGAYLTGMAFGKHKLYERISPKKTWEGFIGGIILSVIIAWVLSIYFQELPLIIWVAGALLVSIFGTLGDLVESMFKRSLNVKESGNLIPGHGGILDRFDGMLLTTPLLASLIAIYYIVFLLLFRY